MEEELFDATIEDRGHTRRLECSNTWIHSTQVKTPKDAGVRTLKLPSLFTACKSHNMKALVILSHA